jgi:multiple sugar transport system substrate-binding protein
MYIDGPWSASGNKPAIKTKFAWDVTPLPHQPGEKPGNTAISNCFTILSGGKHKDDAWKIVSFWTSTDVQKLHTLVPDETPSRKTALPAVKDVPPPPKNMSVFIDSQGISTPIMHTPVYDQMQQTILAGLDLVWTGKKSAQQAVDELTPKVDALLQGKS